MADSTYFAILNAVKTRILDLNLTAIPDANVQVVKTEHFRETIEPGLPGIQIMPAPVETILVNEGTTCRDDVGYPVTVLMMDSDRQDTQTGLPVDADDGTQDQDHRFDEKLHWRERIRKAFINQRLKLTDGYPDVFRCTIEPGEIIRDTDWLEANIWISVLVIRCWTREERG
jgi:hypothetical protein